MGLHDERTDRGAVRSTTVTEEQPKLTSASVPRRMMGPMLPPSEASATANDDNDGVSAATKAFLAREERIRAQRDGTSGSATMASSQSVARPEWMLAPPSATSITEMLQSDPKAALKGRGFSQSATMRVQRTPGSGSGTAPEDVDSRIWTETPQERAIRLQEEQMGVRARATTSTGAFDDAQDEQQVRADREREERVRVAVQEHNAARGPTLLEQHRAKRRAEVRQKDGDEGSNSSSRRRHDERKSRDKKRDNDHRSHRRRHQRDSGDDDDVSRSPSQDGRGERRKHRHASRSSDGSSGSSDDEERKLSGRHHHDDDERKRRRSHRDDRHHRSSRRRRYEGEHRQTSSQRHRDRSRSPDERRRSDKDADRSARREEKERRRERERKKRQRDEEERGAKTGAPMMVWDREAAMSVAGRLMDERKRVDVIRSATGLNDRFGQGSSRYM